MEPIIAPVSLDLIKAELTQLQKEAKPTKFQSAAERKDLQYSTAV